MRAYSRNPDAVRQREAPGRHLYRSPRWRALRAMLLKVRPLCVVCGRPARHIDHIRPHRGSENLFFAVKNLQPLCHSCHSSKTARSDTGFGNRPGQEQPSGACDSDGVPVDPRHPWNR